MHYLRDGVFILGWFGLMAFVWLGWAQEAPPKRARVWLAVGQAIGLLAAVGGGLLAWRYWDTASKLDGRYHWFGLLVAVEVIAAGVACLVLWRQQRTRWFALAVGIVVALHFVPLAFLLEDIGLAVLGLGQTALLLWGARFAQRRGLTPSFVVGVVMGSTLLLSALIAGVLWLPRAITGLGG